MSIPMADPPAPLRSGRPLPPGPAIHEGYETYQVHEGQEGYEVHEVHEDYGDISPRPVQNATVRSFTSALRS